MPPGRRRGGDHARRDVGTAPLIALHFEQVSLAALPANLLAAPAIAPMMWLGILAAAAAQIAEPLAAPFSALTAPLLVYLQRVAQITAATPVSVVEVRASPATIAIGWATLAAATGAVLRRWSRAQLGQDPAPPAGTTSAGRERRERGRRRGVRRRWLVAGAVAAAVSVLVVGIAGRGVPEVLAADDVRVSFLDVGQGDATLIQLGATSVLVDTGPPEGPILERLEESGVKRLDALVLTHAETDHEGAALGVIERFSPRFVVDGGAGWPSAVQRALPGAIARARARLHAPAAGDVIALGQIRLEVLWPPPRATSWRADGNPNNSALVMRLEAGGLSMLLAADAESEITRPLASEPVDVLKVAHHGSADPGLPALLAHIKPRIAAIEVGRDNRYGHPAPSTLAALVATVPTVLRTDRDGTVRLRAVRGRVWVER